MSKLLKLFLSLILSGALCLTLNAHAASYVVSGTVTTADGLLGKLVLPGDAVFGTFEVDDAAIDTGLIGFSDITSMTIEYGGFCITNASCADSVVPITFGSAAVDVSAMAELTGGYIELVSQGPTDFNAFLYFDFDLLTLQFDVCFLGCQTIVGTSMASFQVAQVVPLPASIWLFACALIPLCRRSTFA